MAGRNRLIRMITPVCAALVVGASTSAAPPIQPQPQYVLAAKPGLAIPPPGWAYLPELAVLGPADIYHVINRAADDSGPAQQMRAHTANNAGILTRDVSVPLTARMTLSWQWKIDELPSKLPETIALQHDYFSIAVKFENGRDLTYMWSSSLLQNKGFDCPLAGWTGREYHVVVRPGSVGLGKWLAEKRDVAADYSRYIGGKPPGRIVQVWLIANTAIQHGEATASFGDIAIGRGLGSAPLAVF